MTISVPMQALAGTLVAVGAYFFGNINSAILISKLKAVSRWYRDIIWCWW